MHMEALCRLRRVSFGLQVMPEQRGAVGSVRLVFGIQLFHKGVVEAESHEPFIFDGRVNEIVRHGVAEEVHAFAVAARCAVRLQGKALARQRLLETKDYLRLQKRQIEVGDILECLRYSAYSPHGEIYLLFKLPCRRMLGQSGVARLGVENGKHVLLVREAEYVAFMARAARFGSI